MRCLSLALLLLLGLRAFAQSSGELVEDAPAWDGKTVVFTGEAIGEAMRRGGSAWIHVNDDAYMWRNIEEGQPLGGQNTGIAVWLPWEMTRRITWFGDYRHEGDVVEITGVFRAASPAHGGELMIEGSELRIVRAGHPVPHTVNRARLILAAALAALTMLSLLLHRRRVSRHEPLRGSQDSPSG